MTALRQRLTRRVSEAGTSLIELVVVLALTAVVLPAAYGMVVSAQRAQAITTNRFAALGSAQVIMDRITKDLRAGVGVDDTTTQLIQAQVFLSAGPRDIQFYASLADPNGPTKIHMYTPTIPSTSYDSFNEDLIAANPGGIAPMFGYGTTWTPRINGVYVSPSGPVFSFYNRSGTRIDDGVNALAASVLPSIDSIGISLTTTVNPGSPVQNPLTTINAFVHIRYVDYNPNGS